MAIEHIRFQVCDGCGQRFRDAGRPTTFAKVLCEECLAKGVGSQPEAEPEPVPELSEEELFAGDLDIDSFDAPAEQVEGEAESGSGAKLDEIAARAHARKRLSDDRHTAAQRLRWPLYAACLLLVVVIGVVSLWRARTRGHRATGQVGGEPSAGPIPVLPVPGLPKYEEARELAGRFVREGEVEAVLPMIRPFAGMEEQVALHLKKHPPIDGPAEMLNDMPPVIQTGLVYQSFGLLLRDGTGRLVQVVETSDGPKVDFKAYVEWCSVGAEALLSGEVEEVEEVRAILRPSTYYNFEFSSSQQYEAYSATLAGQREHLTVYVPRDGKSFEPLRRAVRQVGMHPATFSLKAIGESHSRRQYLLSDLHAIGFVVPGEAGRE